MDQSRFRRHFPSFQFVGLLVLLAFMLSASFIWFGFYNIGADAPHSRPIYALLEGLLNRSIAVHARSVKAPVDLSSPTRIAAGAGLYGEMCQSCHLGPGVEKTEIAQGLYPRAPDLAKGIDLTPAQQFWVIKHGVKLTAMPAWGKTHPDMLIWDMVAFLQKLPKMTPQQYTEAVANAPKDHDAIMKEAHERH